MATVEVLLLLAVAAFLAGLAGSYLGIGGGVFLIPFMTLALGIDIKVAIDTSLIGVIATSSGSIAGAVVGILVPNVYLYLTFGVVVLYAAASMVRVAETAKDRAYRGGEEERPLVKRLNLSSVYFDQEDQGVYRYRVERPGAGFGASAAAGVFSGLLGVGGGFIKVPAMNILMRVPMKAAVATSNFMIGVTAAASAFIYYSQGLVNPQLAAMVIVGAFTGTNLGTRLLVRSKAANVRFLFAVFLAGLGIAMAARALGLFGGVL